MHSRAGELHPKKNDHLDYIRAMGGWEECQGGGNENSKHSWRVNDFGSLCSTVYHHGYRSKGFEWGTADNPKKFIDRLVNDWNRRSKAKEIKVLQRFYNEVNSDIATRGYESDNTNQALEAIEECLNKIIGTKTDIKNSVYISNFLDFIKEAESQYTFCTEEMKTQDKLTQDILHSIELDGLKFQERGKLATKLELNRKDRRYYKDRVEEYAPVGALFDWRGSGRVWQSVHLLHI
ncbi:hypothetical protein QE152_g38965 [Popillia japonica]|uniref:Uncharacterized protein n=1 Tax=Popillia japonica TaxID=7064 RepID=A0AAW1HW40_POPJA